MTRADKGERGSHLVDRRRFLSLAATLVGAGVLAACKATSLARRALGDTGPAGGGGSGTLVVSGRMVLRHSRNVGGVVIEPSGELIFDPDRDVTLRTRGNVVVRGRLTMKPGDHRTVHRIVFAGVNESEFVGGGLNVIDSDVGLWVMGRGTLNLAGTQKRAWSRAAGAIAAGGAIDLEHDPDGWRVGDEVALAPTGAPSSGHHTDFEVGKITSIDGRSIRIQGGAAFDHPAVDATEGPTFTAEVLNLSRNVRIEGTAGGRSHVFIRSSRRQSVRHVAIRHVAPGGVLGRYGLHFHHSHDGSRRSNVTAVVVRDAGGHAFVPHMSHGIRFRDCISFDTADDAYWWDFEDTSNDTLYEGCVAALVGPAVDDDRGLRLTGFTVGRGNDNAVRDCVAVAVLGEKTASGFHWPEQGQGQEPGQPRLGVWTFEGNLAHNCAANGIFVWQNDNAVHRISDFTAYRCGKFGIEHGAYFNRYHYADTLLLENRDGGVVCHARSRESGPPITFQRLVLEGSPTGFLEGEINDNATGNPPVLVCAPVFRGVGVDVDDAGVSSQTFNVRPNC